MSWEAALHAAENNPDIIMPDLKARKKKSGTNARKTEAHGIVFDSAIEAARYEVLLGWQKAGIISKLVPHPRFVIQKAFVHPVTGKKHREITWEGDFSYSMRDEKTGQSIDIVEDIKGRRFPQWEVKRPFIVKALGRKILFVNQDLNRIYQLP
jgi:hypothetical protein